MRPGLDISLFEDSPSALFMYRLLLPADSRNNSVEWVGVGWVGGWLMWSNGLTSTILYNILFHVSPANNSYITRAY